MGFGSTGEVIFFEGDPPAHFYLVRRGWVKAVKVSVEGTVLGLLGRYSTRALRTRQALAGRLAKLLLMHLPDEQTTIISRYRWITQAEIAARLGIVPGLVNRLTAPGVGIGTPAYMSPEQGQGQPVDQRTDVYSLGTILFEMLTGTLPYDAETPAAIIFKRASQPLP